MNELNIRDARPGDLPEMQQVARRTIDQCYRAFLGNEGVDWYINSGESDRELAKHLRNCDVLLRDKSVAAFTIYFDNRIHLMMVDVDLHRQGVGSQLLAHSESRLFAGGKTFIQLDTFEGNQQAIDFYIKNDWSMTKKQKDQEHGFIRVLFEKTM